MGAIPLPASAGGFEEPQQTQREDDAADQHGDPAREPGPKLLFSAGEDDHRKATQQERAANQHQSHLLVEKGLQRFLENVLCEQNGQECAAPYGDLGEHKKRRSRVAGESYAEDEGDTSKHRCPDRREDDLATVNYSFVEATPERAQRAGQNRSADDVEQ